MKRPYLVYLLAVVLPSALVIGVGLSAAGQAWEGIARASEARAARMAISALKEDVQALLLSSAAEADATATPEVPPALVQQALQGQTALAVVPSPDFEEGVDLLAAHPPEAGSGADATIRTTRVPLPISVLQAGRASGYRAALYVDGTRRMATEPAPGPDRLEAGLGAALTTSPAGVPLDGETSTGMVVSFTFDDATSPSMAVLIQAPAAPRGPLPIPLLLVMALLLVFASLAGWIQLSGEPRQVSRASVVLLSLVPALTAWGFLVHADRLFHAAVEGADRRDLTRALAMARIRDVATDPVAVYGMTGFHTYRVRDGAVTAASIEGDAAAIAALPAPPPSFTSTGSVTSPEGRVSYVALRIPEGGFTVTTTPTSTHVLDAYRMRARGLAAVLAGWLLVLGGLLAVRSKPVS